MAIDPKLIDGLLADYRKPEDLVGDNGLLKQLTKAILERVLDTELTHHLGYEKHQPAGYGSGNSRNGHGRKKLQGDFGQMELETPRDRQGTFTPQVVAKGQTRWTGFDDKILSLYARGLSTRDIQAHLQEIYQVEVSPTLISQVTDAVCEEVCEWQNRPLEALYPILYLDALRVKIRDQGQVRSKAIHVAIGVTLAGNKDVLGLWIAENEGAKFWLGVLTELQNRGVEDLFIVCVDGLKGLPEAIETVFPQAQVQLCLVHLVRASLQYVGWKQRKEVAQDLRRIYQAPTAAEAERRREEFAAKWDEAYPSISPLWRRNWPRIVPLFGYPPEIRRAIYTTNAVESLNSRLRKSLKTRGSFPSDEAALKLLYLALQQAARKWGHPVRDWKSALNRFAILFAERMPATV